MVLRADAQRNHDRVLDAAAACFGEQGPECSVDEIARRAGVGHGTVFRRFPTKESLLREVVLRRLRELTLLAAEGDFERFLTAAAETYARDRALVGGFDRCRGCAEVDELVAAVDALVRRAQADGDVRADVSAEDVLRLVPTASRYPRIVLDGLRPPRR
jgi:AcrR family transcriptional regulator